MPDVILGERGMVGSALKRLLPEAAVFGKVDLRHGARVDAMFNMLKGAGGIKTVYIAAAKVGGIVANMEKPGDFIYDNLAIELSVIDACRRYGAELVVFLGSSCIYPRMEKIEVARKETDLLTGLLEPSNEHYAIAKIAGIKLLEAYSRQYGLEFLVPMPCNLFGPGDNYDRQRGHFVAGLIRTMHDAKLIGQDTVQLWGTGRPYRELLHVDDCAGAIVKLVQAGARGVVNVGAGVDFPIAAWAQMILAIVGYTGKISWDATKPDGVYRKLLDISKMKSIIGGLRRRDYGYPLAQTYEAFKAEAHRWK